MKEFSKAINAAFGVFQGWKVVRKLQVASPEAGARDWVVLSVKATKLFAKGLKVSQKVPTSALLTRLLMFKGHPATLFKDLASLGKGLNAFYAAIKVVQIMKHGEEGMKQLVDEGGESIWKGYKLSKSILDILDPIVGGKSGWAFARAGRGFLVLKNSIGGIGVVVKAAMLSKELCIAALAFISGASVGTGYQRSHVGMLLGRCHQRKPKRLSCTATRTKESNYLRNLLLVSFPYASQLSNDGLFSLICLFESFAKETRSPSVELLGDDNVSSIFCLALPVPSSDQILV